MIVKKLVMAIACFSLCFLFSSCGLLSKGRILNKSSTPTVTISPSAKFNSTSEPSSTRTPLNPILSPTLNLIKTSGLIGTPPSTPGNSPTNLPYPTLLPTLESTKIPALLEQSFTYRIVKGLNGHDIEQIFGWDYGFKGYEWLDLNHLLIWPIVGQKDSPSRGRLVLAHPAVINLTSGKVWIPPVNREAQWDITNGELPHWSAKLGMMISSETNSSGYFVSIYDPDGNMVLIYPGELVGVSPSGTKILISEDTWIDLITGKTVDFAWDEDYQELYFPRPIWSEDENRVYMCCYFYGDASTGESYAIGADEFSVDGKRVGQPLTHSDGKWVLNGTYLLVQWDFFYDTNPGFVPLFDPAEKTYRDLNKLAGISTDFIGQPNCVQTSPSPDGQYVWVECYDGDYLINLATFETQSYSGYSDVEIYWSSDSEFAWLKNLQPDGNRYLILSMMSKELKPFPSDPKVPVWHPTKAVLAYISEDGLTLTLNNTLNGVIQELKLPVAFQAINWNPQGDHLALLASEGSLWKIDYPNLNKLEQLTLPMADVTDVVWSPDGAFISFISGGDIYILEVNTVP